MHDEFVGTVAHNLPVSEPGQPNPNRGKRFPIEVLSEDEVLALMRACSPRAATGRRNRALLAVLYRGGLRISEALALEPRDLDLERGVLNVRHGKGDKQRHVALDPGACAMIAQWLEVRADLGLARRRHLFCTLKGRPIWSQQVRTTLQTLRRRAGIEKRVHPHGFRHTHAFELLTEHVYPTLIQQQLGHADLKTTLRYLDHLSPEQRLALMREREWGHDALRASSTASTHS